MAARDIIARKLQPKFFAQIDESTVRQAYLSLSPAELNSVLDGIKRGDYAPFVSAMRTHIQSEVKSQSYARADAILADGFISTAELEEILG